MADDELEQIRARRIAEMQQQMGMGLPADMSQMMGGGRMNEEQMEKMKQQEEMKNNILASVLDQQARARLNTIALAKPEKAKMVEGMICQMAQRGQIQSKLGEDQLKSLLERVSEQTQKTTTVKFDRRRAALDSDDDDF